MKNPILDCLIVWCALLSLISIFVTIHDKHSAGKHRRRTPEKTLLLLACLGGSAAMYLTMLLIRHKTKHPKFMLGIPVIIAVQIIILWLLSRRFPL